MATKNIIMTGAMGSGKSAVLKLLQQQNFVLVDVPCVSIEERAEFIIERMIV